jgi:hypothetical protein
LGLTIAIVTTRSPVSAWPAMAATLTAVATLAATVFTLWAI